MPVDTSIYANIKPIDPLGQLKEMADTSQAVTGARSAQVDLQGKVALGKHVQNAIDPATGQVDINRLLTGLKDDPAAWAAAGAGTDMALSQRGAQIANANAGVNLNQAAFSNLGAAWAARAAKSPGPISPTDLASDATDLLVQGRITPDLFKGVLKTLPSDNEDARGYAVGGFISALPSTLTAGAYPAPPDASGAPRQQSGAAFVGQTLGGGAVTTGLAPGVAEGATGVAQAGANYIINTANEANAVPDRKAALQNMLQDIDEFTSGPVSEKLKTLTAGVNEVFGTKFNLEGVGAQERFDKLMNQIVQTQASTLGITDQREKTAMGANPNSSMSPLGIKGNIALLMGNEDAKTAKAQAMNLFLAGDPDNGVPKGSPSQVLAWSNEFNKNYDPRVFQSVYLNDAERKKLVASMSDAERKKFATKFNYAVANGWIPDLRTANVQ